MSLEGLVKAAWLIEETEGTAQARPRAGSAGGAFRELPRLPLGWKSSWREHWWGGGGLDQSDWASRAVVWCIGVYAEGKVVVRGMRYSEENGLEETGGSREEAGPWGWRGEARVEREKPRERSGVGVVVMGREGAGCPLGSCLGVWVGMGGGAVPGREKSEGRCGGGVSSVLDIPVLNNRWMRGCSQLEDLGREETWGRLPRQGLVWGGRGFIRCQPRPGPRAPRETLCHCSWAGPDLLRDATPTAQRGRPKPRAEGELPRSWG